MEMVRNARRRAVKEHQCFTCYRTIEQGEHYIDGKGCEPGEGWSAWRVCAECWAVIHVYRDSIDPDYEGWSQESFDYWVEYRFDDTTLDASTLRDMAGYKHKWRTASGWPWPVSAALKTQMLATTGS